LRPLSGKDHGWRTTAMAMEMAMGLIDCSGAAVTMCVACRMGLSRADLEETIAVHPTTAEELTLMTITKRSGVDPKKVGCCG
jgi:hypothetical protein